jgi:hypothetical protein
MKAYWNKFLALNSRNRIVVGAVAVVLFIIVFELFR